MIKKRYLISMSFYLLALTPFTIHAEISSEKSANPTELHLVLNWKAEPQFGGFFAADFGGEFAREKLKVKVLEGGAGTPTAQMVSAGTAEFGIVSGDELLIARDRGVDLVALFAVYQKNPQGIMTRSSRGFKTLGNLLSSDGRVAWQEGLPYAAFLRQKYSKIKAKTVPYLGGIGNFVADELYSQQCFITSEPIIAEKQKIHAQVFLVADEGFNPYTTVLVTTRKFADLHPVQVRALVRAVAAGWKHYLDEPKPTNSKMAELNRSMDTDTFAESASAQLKLIRPQPDFKVGAMEKVRWQTLGDQLLALKIIKSPVKTEAVVWEQK